MRFYITGDKHGEFEDFADRAKEQKIGGDDMVIILGDSCLNYRVKRLIGSEYLDTPRSVVLKRDTDAIGIRMFIIQGNHEAPAWCVDGYEEHDAFGGKVLVQRAFPNLMFAKNGETYLLGNRKVLVCGGAYTIDAPERIAAGRPWFPEEQMTSREMRKAMHTVITDKVDCVMSHASPLQDQPKDCFKPEMNEKSMDKTTEAFLQVVKNCLDSPEWYCGHYHMDDKRGNIQFLYNDIVPFN